MAEDGLLFLLGEPAGLQGPEGVQLRPEARVILRPGPLGDSLNALAGGGLVLPDSLHPLREFFGGDLSPAGAVQEFVEDHEGGVHLGPVPGGSVPEAVRQALVGLRADVLQEGPLPLPDHVAELFRQVEGFALLLGLVAENAAVLVPGHGGGALHGLAVGVVPAHAGGFLFPLELPGGEAPAGSAQAVRIGVDFGPGLGYTGIRPG